MKPEYEYVASDILFAELGIYACFRETRDAKLTKN